jgi:GTP pyrophosphokinase
MSFDIRGKDELAQLTEKLRQVEGVIDIERSAG